MRFFLLFTSFVICLQLTAQQEPGCKTNLALNAWLDTVKVTKTADNKPSKNPAKKDTVQRSSSGFVDYARTVTHFYVIKPPAGSFKILSFTVNCEETETGDIISIPCNGDTISSYALSALSRCKGNPIDITCIKARHPNGTVFTLKDLHFPSARIFHW